MRRGQGYSLHVTALPDVHQALLTTAAELTRPAVMEQALNIDGLVTGLALPTSPFNTVLGIDKFPEEVLQLMQYSEDLGYYEFVGEPQDFEGQTAEVTPESLIIP